MRRTVYQGFRYSLFWLLSLPALFSPVVVSPSAAPAEHVGPASVPRSVFTGGSPRSSNALFETRGVWFATVLRDGNWPESTLDTADKQAADLRDRIRAAKSLGLNTFVMQVVARGDAMYPSDRLPWSARLRSAGTDPGYDPLATAIDEAHSLGMELHAWINVFRVGDAGTVTQFQGLSEPGHVFYEHPEYVVNRSGELWIDASFAEARSWIVGNVAEIVDNYDVDAVHFDFIRYPEGGLSTDLPNFQFDPRGFEELDDWRRDNITLFVRDANAAVLASKPWVKVGSTPFGNYRAFEGAWPAAWGFSSVFQEARRWLDEGINDYLAPQVYFDIGREPEPGNAVDSPDFAYLVEDWANESFNRPIFVGMGPYKEIVHEELDQQIALTRASGTSQFFFRYDHIKDFDFGTSYPYPALPTPMTHRFEAAAPTTPMDVTAVADTDDLGTPVVRINWATVTSSVDDPLKGYAIFRAAGAEPDVTTGQDLLDVTGADATSYIDATAIPAEDFVYKVAALSRLGFISESSAAASPMPVGVDQELPIPHAVAIRSIFPNPTPDRFTVSFELTTRGEVHIELTDLMGRRNVSLHTGSRAAGVHEVSVGVAGLSAGVYYCTVRTASASVTYPLVIAR